MNYYNQYYGYYPVEAQGNIEAGKSEDLKPTDEVDLGVNFNFFASEDNVKTLASQEQVTEKKKKTTSKRVKVGDENIVIQDSNIAPAQPTVVDTNYRESFSETDNLYRGAIYKTSKLSSDLSEDIDTIRASKTLKGKYTYLAAMVATAATLANTEVNAIGKLNDNIIQGHKLELDRMKAFKLDKAADGNDDMRIMDAYQAFINTPNGVYAPPMPGLGDLTRPLTSGMEGIVIAGNSQQNGLSPEEYAMRFENNPNIQTVLVFDANTGNRYFDVIDSASGQSVPGVPRPDSFLLDDTSLDTRNGVAVNRNINTTWPLVQVGGSVSEY